MTTTTKDNIEIIAANGGAIGLSLTEVNDILITISIILAICVSLVKLMRRGK
tara:strand:- start:332 stop:487 length:156 start_codon:yes stop_codon:yes gene_type:complete